MWGPKLLLTSLALGLVGASVLPEAKLQQIGVRQSQDSCNTPTNRTCWSTGFDIDTDSEVSWPTPNNPPVTYDFEITSQVLSPDGLSKSMLVVNGVYPGPTITANWGDTLVINVKNSMTDNGTSIHWHGINQINTPTEDGVNGITECPIPPGATRTYTFVATQHGTTWYHSHYSGQYGDGVVGSMVINGPAMVPYDEDLGAMPITDYYTQSMWQLGQQALEGGPPVAAGGLINGTMKSFSGTGSYATYTVQADKTYRLRLINTAVDNGFAVSLDGHPFTVIQADFVPLKPYNTTWLFLGIGQRYDVVFTADQAADNYWFRAEVPDGCGTNTLSGSIFAIFSYSTVTVADPTSASSTASAVSCADPTGLEPHIIKAVPPFTYTDDDTDELDVQISFGDGTTVNNWTINEHSLAIDWQQPTLKYLASNRTTGLSTATGLNVYELPEANKFYYWVIQSEFNIPHPIHLHGHDFYVLGQTNGTTAQTFTAASIDTLNFATPPRRDVATLPGNGWMVIAFETNNPGAWLLHCHIAWHVGQGLGVQFLERASEIPLASLAKVTDNCAVWEKWYNATIYKQPDSGLK